MQNKKIVFLASDCESSRWVYHALAGSFSFAAVIIEQPVSRKVLFRNRIKRIGFIKVTGQALFSLFIVPVLRFRSRKRKAALIQQFCLNNDGFPAGSIHVGSVNDDRCEKILQDIRPDIVVVNGTRIISRRILDCTDARFINMHVGITPAYRGSHGGYWAVHNNDLENFGTTIHLVDTGVDTGSVLKQVFARPAPEDNFCTYPVIQTGIGISALKEVLLQFENGSEKPIQQSGKGTMYHQPTVLEYFNRSLRAGKQ